MGFIALNSICTSTDRPFLHERNGEAILFGPESFEDLRMKSVCLNSQNAAICFDRNNPILVSQELDSPAEGDRGMMSDAAFEDGSPQLHSVFIEDLYFVTKDGALDSIPSKAMSWVLNKISCETQFDDDLADQEAVEDLRLRVEVRYPHLMSTYDLISLYSRNQLTEQLFVVKENKM